MMANEFDLIKDHFAPLSHHIGDDCAILDLPPGERLAISVDTMVLGVHFSHAATADQVAFRAVAAALSDLAAMGARPLAITLALTLPDNDETWLGLFAAGIADSLQTFKVELLGGDTTSGPLTVSIQVFGALPEQQALMRGGARPGDAVFISGATGDAAAALAVLAGSWKGDPQYEQYLLERFYRPTPRLDLGQQLLDCASSAIDISDGLLADAGHLCKHSGFGIHLDVQALPLSPALKSLPDKTAALTLALSGGDDYELLFTVPQTAIDRLPPGCTRIGEVTSGTGVVCDHDTPSVGYQHFEKDTRAASQQGDAGSVDTAPARDEPAPQYFASWAQFLAFGFGSGMSPKAPGTAGTLVAVPLYLLLAELGLLPYTALLLVAAVFGVWLCGQASRELGVHDHPGIVWDEFVGFWITMWALPATWQWVLAGFLLFRVFDILKPWPISWCDRQVHGGLGIMLDDILAGIVSCLLLHGAFWMLYA
jgi:thiamine-monophosphate kinase